MSVQPVAIPSKMKKVKTQKKKRSKQGKGPIVMAGNIPLAETSTIQNYFSLDHAPRNYGPGAIEIKGQDYIASILVQTASPGGTNLFNYMLNPGDSVFSGTRLAAYAQLYEKFVFKNFQVHALPNAATTISGSHLLAYDRDPTDPTPAANSDGLKIYYGLMGTRSTQIYNRLTIDCPLSDFQDFYYCNQGTQGAEERLVYQGQLYGALVAPVSQNTSYDLWISYDIVLFDPTLEQANQENMFFAGSNSPSTTATAGYDNLTSGGAVSQNVQLRTDTAGHKYLDLPSGNWLVESIATNPSVGNSFLTPSVLANDVARQLYVAVTNLNNFAAPLATGAAFYRTDRITLPSGGGKVYGNINSSGTLGSMVLRAIKANVNWL